MSKGINIQEFEALAQQSAQKQQDIQQLLEDQTKLGFQKRENEIVLDEFEFLDNQDVIYKKVGPILVKSELEEAKQNIHGRLEYINDQIKSKQDQVEKAQKEYQEIQVKLAAMQAQLK